MLTPNPGLHPAGGIIAFLHASTRPRDFSDQSKLLPAKLKLTLRRCVDRPQEIISVLSGFRVLVVEDEALVAEDLTHIITEAEGTVVGPYPSVGEARALLKSGTSIDAALLDVNVSDGTITPILEALHARRIPTVVYTGGAVPEDVRGRHPDLTVLSKAGADCAAGRRTTSGQREACGIKRG